LAVVSAAESLRYSRSAPRRWPSRLFGVIVPELENPIFSAFAQQITNLLAQGGDTPMLCTQTARGVSEDRWIELLLERDVDGIVVVSGMHADSHADTERYHRLRAMGIPLVLVNGFVEDVDAARISDDDRTAMSLAVEHLTALGHERIGLAVGPERYVPVIRKVAGFVEAIKAPPRTAAPLVEHSLFTLEGGRAAARRLLEQGATAIVCGSDLMALGAIRACRGRHVSVPQDVSVIGYDDSALMAFAGPPLTTIRQSVGAMSEAAVRMILDEAAGAPAPREELLFQPELVVRGSTGPAPARRKTVPGVGSRRRQRPASRRA
jgi:DNA-binding LacI/PurR family transcriptional regulator